MPFISSLPDDAVLRLSSLGYAALVRAIVEEADGP